MLSLRQVQNTIQLPPIQLANILRDTLQYPELPGADLMLRPGDCLAIWLWDACLRHREAPQDQLAYLMRELAPYLIAYGDDLQRYIAAVDATVDGTGAAEVPVMVVGFADGKYATIDDNGFWELRTGRKLGPIELDPPPLRTVVYNLATLCFQHYNRVIAGGPLHEHTAADLQAVSPAAGRFDTAATAAVS